MLDLQVFFGTEPQVYDCGDGAAARTFFGADAGSFAAVCDSYRAAGFTAADEWGSAGNWFCTMTGAAGLAQISFFPREERLVVTEDPQTAIPPTTDAPRRSICRPTFYQFEVDHSLIDCGMCLILQLADGSFFVIDSAHPYSTRDEDRLHAFLRERAPAGEKIIIAGWFVTHAHDDHVGKLTDYLDRHMDDTVIERVYMNLVAEDHRDARLWGEAHHAFDRRFREALARRPEIPVVKLHTGQRFAVREAVFTVLCTHEDVWPGSFADFNETSTVLMCRIAGQKILIPGDASAQESTLLESRFGEALRCDILQVAHHGHAGLSANLYRLTNAATALFPVTYIMFLGDLERYEADRVILSLCREYYIASDGTVGLPLPYRAGTAIRYPDETVEDFDGIYRLWQYEYTDAFRGEIFRRFAQHGGRQVFLPAAYKEEEL